MNSFINKINTSRYDLDGAAHNWVEFFVLVHNRLQRVIKYPKWKGQVYGNIFVYRGWFIQQEFYDLHSNSSNNHSSRCSNSRNNLTSDKFDFKIIDFLNFIVSCLEIKKIFTRRLETPLINSICQLVGSSFSNSIGLEVLLLSTFNDRKNSERFLHYCSSSASIYTGSFDFYFFSSVSILIFFAKKGFLEAFDAILATVNLSF